MDTLNCVYQQYQSILDVSPSKIKELNDAKQNITIDNDVQSTEMNGKAIIDCPVAILVDVPNSSSLHLKENNTQHNYTEKNKLSESKTVTAEIEDLEGKVCVSAELKKCSELEYSDYSPESNQMKDHISVKRLRWKTPSPQSMSRITKEASKVIHNLKSTIFDEDSLLTEELIPIPINFDDFDLDNNLNQKDILSPNNAAKHEVLADNLSPNIQTKNIPSTDDFDLDNNLNQKDILSPNNAAEHEVLGDNLSPNIQTKNIPSTDVIDQDVNNYSNLKDPNSFKINISKNIQDIPLQVSPEEEFPKVSLGSSAEHRSKSQKSCSSENHSNYLDHSDISPSYDKTDDVFILKHISIEDKENIQKKENQAFLTNVKNCITGSDSLLIARTKLENRGTLGNLSNIEHEPVVSAKFFSPVKRSINSPLSLKKVNLPAKTDTQLPTRKAYTKQAASLVESKTTSKVIPRSNSFQSAKKPSVEKQCSIMKHTSFLSDSACKLPSSNLKQDVLTKTPSRRYSLCTPVKSASIAKSSVTPTLHSFQTPAIPRYTPQSRRTSQFSFSKSLQLTSNISNSSAPKGLKKQQNSLYTTMSHNTSKLSPGMINFSKPEKHSLSHSMSAISFQSLKKNAMSTSSKGRFCSKLGFPSPLPVDEDKKLARALFPSIPKK